MKQRERDMMLCVICAPIINQQRVNNYFSAATQELPQEYMHPDPILCCTDPVLCCRQNLFMSLENSSPRDFLLSKA